MQAKAVYHYVLQHLDALPLTGPKVIGVNGVDTSGKTCFAVGLSKYLTSQGRKVAIVHIDDFHNPSAIRALGDDPVSGYIDNAFDLKTLEIEILQPAKHGLSFDKTLVLLDLETDSYSRKQRFIIDPNTIVIVEGVLLYRPPLDQYIDLRVFLQIPFEEVIHRATIRDVPRSGTAILDRYCDKYLPVQKWYLAAYMPMERSDVVIDNADYMKPRILR